MATVPTGGALLAAGAGSSTWRDGAAIKMPPMITAAAAPPNHHKRFDPARGSASVSGMAGMLFTAGVTSTVDPSCDCDSIAVMRARDCSRKFNSACRISSAD